MRRRSVCDPGCVKTPETRKPGEMFSQIARNLPRSETVVALMAIRKDGCSINFPRRRVFTQPSSKAVVSASNRSGHALSDVPRRAGARDDVLNLYARLAGLQHPAWRSEQVRLDHFGARVGRKQSVNDICDGIEGQLPRCRDAGSDT